MNIANDYIAAELERIRERLLAGPDPFQHAGLYAAQQALSWAASPDAFKSPYDLVTGTPGGSRDCPEFLRPPQS